MAVSPAPSDGQPSFEDGIEEALHYMALAIRVRYVRLVELPGQNSGPE